jgi:ribosomal protein S18 acetylase RimI-like enzyme
LIIKAREVHQDELDQLQNFLVSHGSNQWNYLPEHAVQEQFHRLFKGTDHCIVAIVEDEIVGLIIYRSIGDVPQFFKVLLDRKHSCYVAEVVVHSNFSSRGIGTMLLQKVAMTAQEQGAHHLVIDRHEQNLPSAGMMSKAGFKELDCFYDPDRRSAGAQKTTTLRLDLNYK